MPALIHHLDLNFQDVPQTIASFLVEGEDGMVLVESGPGSTLPALLDHMKRLGVALSDLKAILVTHIHLDHAGAAGWLSQQSGAPIYVHQVGAPHLIDPSRLLFSAGRIYGDEMDKLWGVMVPASADLVIPIKDGDTITAAGLTFTAIDSPGHAWHHHTFALDEVAFTGDAAGIYIAGNWVDLPTPPPEFNLEAWLSTILRLKAWNFKTLFPAHFSPINSVSDHFERFETNLRLGSTLIKQEMQNGTDRDQIIERFLAWGWERAQNAGIDAELWRRYEVAGGHAASVDGMMRYWGKRIVNGTW